jgi:ribose 5-phosphate isomerase
MKIETKFSRGDVVWFIKGAYILDLKIKKIDIIISESQILISYEGHSERGMFYRESQDNVFSSKDECALIWLKNQGLEVGIK